MALGLAPEYITAEKVFSRVLLQLVFQVYNYDEEQYGILVSPPHSARVYRKPAIEQVFLLLLLLVVLGEFFSAPGLPLADSCTLNYVKETPQQVSSLSPSSFISSSDEFVYSGVWVGVWRCSLWELDWTIRTRLPTIPVRRRTPPRRTTHSALLLVPCSW